MNSITATTSKEEHIMARFLINLGFYLNVYAFIVWVVTAIWCFLPSYPESIMLAGRWIIAAGITLCVLAKRSIKHGNA